MLVADDVVVDDVVVLVVVVVVDDIVVEVVVLVVVVVLRGLSGGSQHPPFSDPGWVRKPAYLTFAVLFVSVMPMVWLEDAFAFRVLVGWVVVCCSAGVFSPAADIMPYVAFTPSSCGLVCWSGLVLRVLKRVIEDAASAIMSAAAIICFLLLVFCIQITEVKCMLF